MELNTEILIVVRLFIISEHLFPPCSYKLDTIITNESLPNTENRIIVLKNKMRKSKTELNDQCKCYLYFLLRDTTKGLLNCSNYKIHLCYIKSSSLH